MPPRDQQLPEGTDQIINGAMETGAGTGASTGSSGGFGDGGFGGTGSGGTTPGGSADFAGSTGTGAAGGGTGFIGAGGGSSDDTGGLAGGMGGTGSSSGSDFGGGSAGLATSGGAGGGLAGGSDFGGGSGGSGGGGSSGGSGGGGSGGGVTGQVQGGVQSLKQQATEKVRTYAEDGKSRATSALDDLAQLVEETAQSIDERLGPQYGDYARRAAGTVTDLSERLRGKEVDELFDDAREIVRKSPGVAIGVAAVAGFALVRLIKSGIPDQSSEVEFQPDPQLGAGSSGGTSPAGSSEVGSQAPYVAPITGA